jgi:hypothetical protein
MSTLSFHETRAVEPPAVTLGALPLVAATNSPSVVPFESTKLALMADDEVLCVGCSCQTTSQRSANAVTAGSTE